MSKPRFRRKVIYMFLFGMMVSLSLLILSVKIMIRPLFIWDSQKMMKKYSQQIEKNLTEDSDEIQILLEEMYDAYLIQCTIIGEDRTVLYNTNYTYHSMDPERQERRISWYIDAYEKRSEESDGITILGEEEQIKRVIYMSKVQDTYIILKKSIRGIEQEIKLAKFCLGIFGVVLAVIMVLVWMGLTRPFIRSIEKMSIVTKKMSDLDFTEKVIYYSDDEIGVLAKSINRLSDELSEYICGMQEEVDRRKALVRNLSHELRTPVTTIRGYAENLKILVSDNKKVNRYCDIMIEECDSVTELSEYMLDMSQMESDGCACSKEDIVMSELEKDLRETWQQNYGKERVIFCFQEDVIKGNSLLLKRALSNYIDNAMKYGDGNRILVEGKNCADRYWLSVRNTGRKIKEEEQKKIWDVFYKENKARTRDNGYGLGLAFVKEIALLHKGGVDVNSTEKETVFSIWIAK